MFEIKGFSDITLSRFNEDGTREDLFEVSTKDMKMELQQPSSKQEAHMSLSGEFNASIDNAYINEEFMNSLNEPNCVKVLATNTPDYVAINQRGEDKTQKCIEIVKRTKRARIREKNIKMIKKVRNCEMQRYRSAYRSYYNIEFDDVTIETNRDFNSFSLDSHGYTKKYMFTEKIK